MHAGTLRVRVLTGDGRIKNRPHCFSFPMNPRHDNLRRFPADSILEIPVFRASKAWIEKQATAVSNFASDRMNVFNPSPNKNNRAETRRNGAWKSSFFGYSAFRKVLDSELTGFILVKFLAFTIAPETALYR
jgi:hypothetical protein